MSQQLVLGVIGVVVAVIVLRPLLRGKRSAPMQAEAPLPAPASRTSDELSELELDHDMGRVGDADYQRWRAELDRDPAAVNEMAASRGADGRLAGRAEDLVRRWKEAPRPTCPTCGVRPEPEARYCSNCGAGL